MVWKPVANSKGLERVPGVTGIHNENGFCDSYRLLKRFLKIYNNAQPLHGMLGAGAFRPQFILTQPVTHMFLNAYTFSTFCEIQEIGPQ